MEFGNLVKTEYGFHIVQVLEKAAGEGETLRGSEDRTRHRAQAGRGVYPRCSTSIDQARAELAKTPKNAAQIAAKYNLTYADVQKAGKGQADPGSRGQRRIWKGLFRAESWVKCHP